ncbi:hypothetical protein BDZ88DRAFT_423743 [Geranomyces variabilis]|nr:hypothetical protein BDZ88DRAFT_423743 [Geranomyces variabilis]
MHNNALARPAEKARLAGFLVLCRKSACCSGDRVLLGCSPGSGRSGASKHQESVVWVALMADTTSTGSNRIAAGFVAIKTASLLAPGPVRVRLRVTQASVQLGSRDSLQSITSKILLRMGDSCTHWSRRDAPGGAGDPRARLLQLLPVGCVYVSLSFVRSRSAKCQQRNDNETQKAAVLKAPSTCNQPVHKNPIYPPSLPLYKQPPQTNKSRKPRPPPFAASHKNSDPRKLPFVLTSLSRSLSLSPRTRQRTTAASSTSTFSSSSFYQTQIAMPSTHAAPITIPENQHRRRSSVSSLSASPPTTPSSTGSLLLASFKKSLSYSSFATAMAGRASPPSARAANFQGGAVLGQKGPALPAEFGVWAAMH